MNWHRGFTGPLATMGRAMQRVGVKHKMPELVVAGLKAQAEAAAQSVQEPAGRNGHTGEGGNAGDGYRHARAPPGRYLLLRDRP